MDRTEVRPMLNDRIDAVVSYLLPLAEQISDGKQYQVGSVNGEAGQSLRIERRGDKVGLWKDHATKEGGDIVALWKAVRGGDWKHTFEDMRGFLGLQREPLHDVKKKVLKPLAPKDLKAVSSTSDEDAAAAVDEYLTQQRGLKLETLSTYKIGGMLSRKRKPVVAFPYYTPTGELVSMKYLALQRGKDGSKFIMREEGTPSILFGWQAVPDDALEVAIVEGELDAPSVYQMLGVPALSLPDGAMGLDNWLELEYDNLARFEKIYIVTDNDPEGRAAAKGLSKRLGVHRCYLVVPPEGWGKDANAWLVEGQQVRDVANLFIYAEHMKHSLITSVAEQADDVIRRRHQPLPGIDLPWTPRHTFKGQDLRLRFGEAAILVGMSGSGKSTIAQHLAIEARNEGIKSAIASIELPPSRYLGTMIDQASGGEARTETEERAVLDWLNGWVIPINTTAIGQVSAEEILDAWEYAFRVHGAKLFILDSLTMLEHDESDNSAQKETFLAVQRFAKKNEVIVIVVMHVRKPGTFRTKSGERLAPDEPDKFDVRGASGVTDAADAIYVFHRNLAKEKKIEDASSDAEAELIRLSGYDATLRKVKDREKGHTARFDLYFVPKAKVYVSRSHYNPPTIYVDISGV